MDNGVHASVTIGLWVACYVLILNVLRKSKTVQFRPLPPPEHAPATLRFPSSVKLRGFAGASFQESGGYSSDAIVNGKMVHFPGTETDWTWRASDGLPPPWASGLLPMYFATGNGCDSEMDKDLCLMRQAGATAYRFSICWAKLQPRRRGSFNMCQVHSLNRKLSKIIQYGMVPIVTVVHFVLPVWFPGWHDESSLDDVADFAKKLSVLVSRNSGLEYWVTINEPSIATVHGYVVGDRPPGIQSLPVALTAYANMLRAHVEIASQLRKRGPGVQASPAWNVSLFEAHKSWFLPDECLACFMDMVFNRSMIKLLTRGYAWVGPHFVQGEDIRRVDKPIFIAINTYTRVTVRFLSIFEEPDVDHEAQPQSIVNVLPNDLRWDIGTQHLWSVLESVHDSAPDCSIVITEHGIPDNEDRQRRILIRETASLLHSARYVSGYMHWSFTRNVEWELAMHGNFGVVDVDFANQFARRPRKSYSLLKRMWSR